MTRRASSLVSATDNRVVPARSDSDDSIVTIDDRVVPTRADTVLQPDQSATRPLLDDMRTVVLQLEYNGPQNPSRGDCAVVSCVTLSSCACMILTGIASGIIWAAQYE